MLKVTDRVPTYAGRIQLIVVDETNGIYDMVRADEPSVVGTPLNAALFNSIAADLANIAPPLVGVAEKVGNSRNVAFYPSLGAVGFESTASLATGDFMNTVFPPNSGLFCTVIANDTIVLTDLPSNQGTLLLMKGEASGNCGGLFCAKTGGLYIYSAGSWGQYGGGATAEQAAQIQANADAIASIQDPVVSGNTHVDGDTYMLTVNRESGVVDTHVLEFDDNGYISKVTENGREIPWTTTGV